MLTDLLMQAQQKVGKTECPTHSVSGITRFRLNPRSQDWKEGNGVLLSITIHYLSNLTGEWVHLKTISNIVGGAVTKAGTPPVFELRKENEFPDEPGPVTVEFAISANKAITYGIIAEDVEPIEAPAEATS